MATGRVVEGGEAQKPWIEEELAVIVASYLEMLQLQELGRPFNKAQRVREVQAALPARSRRSVENKYQNISAILNLAGIQALRGYRPLVNFQGALARTVELALAKDEELLETLRKGVEADASPTPISSHLRSIVQAPNAVSRASLQKANRALANGVKRDYLALETANRSLGLAGEMFALEFEKRRLTFEGREDLARKIEHVSMTQGDGLGFDVRSYSADGSERMIEVKTTAYGIHTPFFVSANEVIRSADLCDRYWVYRVFNFRSGPKLFVIQGSISTSFALAPSIYIATILPK